MDSTPRDLIGQPRIEPLTGKQRGLGLDWSAWAASTTGRTSDVFVPDDTRTEATIRRQYDATETPRMFR